MAPGLCLLSEQHGEGAAVKGLELSSQTTGLFQVCHGYGFGGCQCRLSRNRLGALSHGLGEFAGEGASRYSVIEWLVVLPYLMAMTSLATAVA
jgi:hypothetical protein